MSQESTDYKMLPVPVQKAFNDVDVAIDKAQAISSIAENAVNTISHTILQTKEMQLAFKQLDVQVELLCKEYDVRIEKTKMAAQIVQMQLTRYSSQLDQLLQKVLSMDVNSNDPNYIRHRSELIAVLRGLSDSINNMFMHFLLN